MTCHIWLIESVGIFFRTENKMSTLYATGDTDFRDSLALGRR